MPAMELERIQEKYYTAGTHVSEIIKGTKTVYESGPAIKDRS
jgi:hypothetical protein